MKNFNMHATFFFQPRYLGHVSTRLASIFVVGPRLRPKTSKRKTNKQAKNVDGSWI